MISKSVNIKITHNFLEVGEQIANSILEWMERNLTLSRIFAILANEYWKRAQQEITVPRSRRRRLFSAIYFDADPRTDTVLLRFRDIEPIIEAGESRFPREYARAYNLGTSSNVGKLGIFVSRTAKSFVPPSIGVNSDWFIPFPVLKRMTKIDRSIQDMLVRIKQPAVGSGALSTALISVVLTTSEKLKTKFSGNTIAIAKINNIANSLIAEIQELLE